MKFSVVTVLLVLALAISCEAFFKRYGGGGHHGGHDHYDNHHGGNYHYYKRDTAAALGKKPTEAKGQPLKVNPGKPNIPSVFPQKKINPSQGTRVGSDGSGAAQIVGRH